MLSGINDYFAKSASTPVNSIDDVASPQSNYEKYKDMYTDKHDLITMDNFYSLLVAEMQNQDPLEPTSNTEFISQMASFTAMSAQQDAYETQLQSYANSLVGRTVTVNAGDGATKTGVVEFVTHGDNPQVSVNGEKFSLSAISQVSDAGITGQQTASIGDYGAFAAGILGKTAVVQSIDSTGLTFFDEGVVDSLEIQNGNVRVVVNGYAYDATDVLRVTDTAAAGTAAAAESGTAAAQSVTESTASQNTQRTADNTAAQTAAQQADSVTAQEAASTAGTQTAGTAQTAENEIGDDNDAVNAVSGDDYDIYELFE